MRRAKGYAWLESGLMRIVTIGATHDDAPALPAVEPLAVRTMGPGVCLGEVALGTQPVALIEGRPLAALERQVFDVVGRMAGRAEGPGLRRVHRADVLVGVGDALLGHDELSAEMT